MLVLLVLVDGIVPPTQIRPVLSLLPRRLRAAKTVRAEPLTANLLVAKAVNQTTEASHLPDLPKVSNLAAHKPRFHHLPKLPRHVKQRSQ